MYRVTKYKTEMARPVRLSSGRRFAKTITEKYFISEGPRKATNMFYLKKVGGSFMLKTQISLSLPVRLISRYYLRSSISSRREYLAEIMISCPAPKILRSEHHGIWDMYRFLALANRHSDATVKPAVVKDLIAKLSNTYPVSFVRQLTPAGHEPPASYGREVLRLLDINRLISRVGSRLSTSVRLPYERILTFTEKVFERRRTTQESMKMERAQKSELSDVTYADRILASNSRKRLAGPVEAPDIIFRTATRIQHKVEELKRIVRETEAKVREDVVRIGEMSAGHNHGIDISRITDQVCRNIERMVKWERERRGM